MELDFILISYRGQEVTQELYKLKRNTKFAIGSTSSAKMAFTFKLQKKSSV